jgi:hypothetical protein
MESTSGWERFESPSGFQVEHPRGWLVEARDGGLIVIGSPDRTAFALIQPFLLRAPVSAAAWLRQAPALLAALFPQATLQRCEQQTWQPDEALASLTFAGIGQPAQASLLCSIDGLSGMLYGLAAPQAQFAAWKETLLAILRSFKFTSPTADQAPAYVRWSDPREGAFSLEVPTGWSVQGGMFSFQLSDARPAVEAVAPDQSIRINVGDAKIPPFCVPNAMLSMTGFREGSWYSPGYGLQMQVWRYMTGVEFARHYITAFRPYPQLTVTAQQDRPDIAHLLSAGALQMPGMMRTTITAGEVYFTYGGAPPPFVGYCLVATRLTETFNIANWNIEALWTCVATQARAAAAKEILTHMMTTFTPNPVWLASRSQAVGVASTIVSRTNNEISTMIMEGYQRRQAVQDDLQRQWSNTILGLTDVVDPQTGETWKVSAGHNYYWHRGNTIVGTDVYDRPDINFEPLRQW